MKYLQSAKNKLMSDVADSNFPGGSVNIEERIIQVTGHIDVIEENLISGWYINNSQENPLLRFYADGVLISETTANLERIDVKQVGYSTSLCGFQAILPFFSRVPNMIEIEDVAAAKKLWVINFKEKRVASPFLNDDAIVAPEISSEIVRKEVSTDLRILFDVSDLVYYLGHHDNLTGIQRVQSSVIQAIFQEGLLPGSNVHFICFDAHQKRFKVIDQRSFTALLIDLSLPLEERKISYDRMRARTGTLFVAGELTLTPSDREKTVISLLGAAWVIPDYVRTMLDLKREFGVRFVPTFHDLIPIYAKDTCDQGTAEVFKAFLDQIIRHVDVGLCVSENTASDLRRYCEENDLPLPPTHVTRNGSSLSEFFSIKDADSASVLEKIPSEPYALFVSTVEGRKNHVYAFQIWQTLIKSGVKMPKLVCVGRLGWRAEEFLQSLLRTNNLDGLIEIVEDISDAELEALYKNCQFTIYPSVYEGWGLPVGESLAYGKPCVLTRSSSLPEVAGDLGIYIPLNNLDEASRVIRELVEDPNALSEWTSRVEREYKPVQWGDVAKEVIAGCRLALMQAHQNLYPVFKLGNEYLFRRLRVDTHGRMGQSMLQGLLQANQRVILPGHASQDDKLFGLESRSGPWYDPEVWGCWSNGMKANLMISLESFNPQVENICAYLAFQIPGQYVPCQIALKISGVTIGTPQGINSTTDIKLWLIPAKLIREKAFKQGTENALIQLEFSLVDVTVANIEKLKTIDQRNLGLGLKSLLITDDTDLATRCSVLEKMIFDKG